MSRQLLYYLYNKWVDPSLNYGREAVVDLARRCEAPGHVLDIAAGHGQDLGNVGALFPLARLSAFDFLEASVQRLRERGFAAHSVNLERDPFPVRASEVDLLIANQILEHTKDVFWIWHQITSALALGGHVIIGVPNLASLHNRLLLAVGSQPTSIRTASAHVRGFTRPDLMDFLDSCFPGGYQLVRYAGSNFYPFPAALARPLARAFPSLAYANFYLLRKSRAYNGEFLAFPAAQQLETNFFTGHPADAATLQ